MPLTHAEFVADVAILYNATGYGSGRLIAPGLILTARHVIDAQPGDLQSSWNVLLLRDLEESGKWESPYRGVLAWVANDHLDIALIKILPNDRQVPTPTPRLKPVFAAYDRITSLPEVIATGFPESWRQGGKTRDFSVPGTLWIPTRNGPYGWTVGASPDKSSGWRGMSGAAVCHQGKDDQLYLFGVVQQVPANFSYGQLEVARFSEAFKDLRFRTQLKSALGSDPHITQFDQQHLPISASHYSSHVKSRFPALTDGVTGNRFASLEEFLSEYLLRPSAPLQFLGRVSELYQLDHWLNDADSSSYFAVLGLAGRGKSALLSQWAAHVASSGRSAVVLVPISIRFDLARPNDLAKLFLQRLRHIFNDSSPFGTSLDDWVDEIHRYLTSDNPIAGSGLLIIIDGWDEAIDSAWIRFPPLLARGVKILISSRILAGETVVTNTIERIGLRSTSPHILLPPLTRIDLIDVDSVLENRIPGAAERLWKLTNGDPLLVRLYLEWFAQYSDRPEQLPEVDPNSQESGLARYMRMWWQQIERVSGNTISKEMTRFLYLLACAYGPLTVDDAEKMVEVDALSISAARGSLSRILIGNGNSIGYAFSHPRIGQYLAEELMTKSIRAHYDKTLLDYCHSVSRLIGANAESPAEPSRYVLSYCIDHFRRGSVAIEDYVGLLGQGWMLAHRTLDGYYAGYLSDLRRIQHDSRVASDLRIDARCALAISTIVSLSDAVPSALLRMALDNQLVTGTQAVEMIRGIPDAHSRATALALVAPTLNQDDSVRALEVAKGITNQESRMLAYAGLADHLPLPTQEELADELSESTESGSPIAALLASTSLKKVDMYALSQMDVEASSRDLDAALSRLIWTDIDSYIKLVGEVADLLHSSDREQFATLVANTTSHRAYKWKELDRVQRLVREISEYASLDAVASLSDLLSQSHEPSGEGALRLQARHAALTNAIGSTQNVLEQMEDQIPWAAVAAFPLMNEETARRWAELCITKTNNAQLLHQRGKDIARCLPHCSAQLRHKFVKEMWDLSRQVMDADAVVSFGGTILPLLTHNYRSYIADRFADRLTPLPRYSWEAHASIALEVSEARFSTLRDVFSEVDAALLAIASRFSPAERKALLQKVLDSDYVGTDIIKAVVRYFSNVSHEEQSYLAEQFLERIVGKELAWRTNRKSSLLWAELIESFAPLVTNILGNSVVPQIERVTPYIANRADRALAFASLASCSSADEAVVLSWKSLIEFAYSRGGERHRLLSDLHHIPALLPDDDPPAAFRSTKADVAKARSLLKELREAAAMDEESRVNQILREEGVEGLRKLWSRVTQPSIKLDDTMRALVGSLTTISADNIESTQMLWTLGLESASGGGRGKLILYLTITAPWLANLVSSESLEEIAADVLDVTSWSWR